MGKKYYQDREDRMHESKGMKKYMKDSNKGGNGYGMYGDFVKGHDPDIGRDSHAGLPDEKVMSYYPKGKSMRGGYMDDSISDIDQVQNQADKTSYSHMSHQK